MKFLRDILTADAQSSVYDLVRVATGGSLVTGIGLVCYTVIWREAPFDFVAFGTGVGLILAAGAGGMWARKDVEAPQSQQEPTERQ